MEEYDYRIAYVRGKCNIKADALSRCRNENKNNCEITDDFDDKIYVISPVDDANFKSQLLTEQQLDVLISTAINDIKKGDKITKGRLKRVNNQLRIENGLLTKSGRPMARPITDIYC